METAMLKQTSGLRLTMEIWKRLGRGHLMLWPPPWWESVTVDWNA